MREARAAYFPTVTLGVGDTRSAARSTSTALGAVVQRRPGDSSSLPTRTSSCLSTSRGSSTSGDGSAARWSRTRPNAQASAGDLEAARLSFQAELAQDYFQLRTLDAQKQLLDETVAAFEKSLELTQDRFASGVASQADVRAGGDPAQDHPGPGDRRGRPARAARARDRDADWASRPPTFRCRPRRSRATPPAIPVGVPSELLERRPDIAAAERRVAAANAQIGVADGRVLPDGHAQRLGGFESSSLAKWFTAASRFWSVGPGISETVFDGGLRRAQTDSARAAYDATVATYRQTVLTAFQGVEDNLAALRILEEEAGVQDEAVKAAEKSVVLTTDQYKAGTVSYLNVITAQTIALTERDHRGPDPRPAHGRRRAARPGPGRRLEHLRPTIEPVSNKRLGLKSICIAPTLE